MSFFKYLAKNATVIKAMVFILSVLRVFFFHINETLPHFPLRLPVAITYKIITNKKEGGSVQFKAKQHGR